MGTLGKTLRDLRIERGLTQKDLAEKLDATRATLANWETGRAQPSPESLLRIAEFFQVSLDELIGHGLPGRPAKLATVPLLGTIKAGTPPTAKENLAGTVDVPADWQADFAIRVSSDSMSWAGIHSGDIAALQRPTAVQSGMIVAVGLESPSWVPMLKYYIREGGQVMLRAANPSYADRTCTPQHCIIGTVVGILKRPTPYQDYQAQRISRMPEGDDWTDVIKMAARLGMSSSEVSQLMRMFAKASGKLTEAEEQDMAEQ